MIVIITGLPRSGTSMLMQMLAAGGLPPLTDGLRTADDHNPRGYWEWEAAKQLPRDPNRIAAAEGKAVKVVAPLLPHLPMGPAYRLLLIRRDTLEVARSQAAMLARTGASPALRLPEMALALALAGTLRQTEAWLARQPHLRVLCVEHAEVLRSPLSAARRVTEFLALKLDTAAMAAQVDPQLHRQRGSTAQFSPRPLVTASGPRPAATEASPRHGRSSLSRAAK